MCKAVRKICVFTAGRSEYGLLRPLLRQLRVTDVTLVLLVTGSHLASSRGNTVRELEEDGLADIERVEILLDSASATAVCTATGIGLIRFADVFSRILPDMLVVLGDRFETLSVALAASILKIPVAHLHGGELTFGAIDDAFRHAITKLSHLHFASTSAHRRRIIQMGEHPSRVFDVGALGVENVLNTDFYAQDVVRDFLRVPYEQSYLVATYHPSTLDSVSSITQIETVLDAVCAQQRHMVIFTGANADEEGAELNILIDEASKKHPEKLRYFASLGTRMYLSTLKYSSLVLGNSSSGLIEAPSLHIPTIDIGNRQRGRTRAESVITVPADYRAICEALELVSSRGVVDAEEFRNPYEGVKTSETIASTLRTFDLHHLVEKEFWDLPTDAEVSVSK